MVLALILIFVLILFLAVIIASAVLAPGEGSNKGVSAPQLPARPQRRVTASRRPTRGTLEPPKTYHLTQPGLAEPQVNYFTAVGRRNFDTTYETTGFEEVFTSGNKPFKVGGRNDSDDCICFLTGQPKGVCQCAEHVNGRQNGDH